MWVVCGVLQEVGGIQQTLPKPGGGLNRAFPAANQYRVSLGPTGTPLPAGW